MQGVYVPPLYSKPFPVAVGPAAGLAFVNGSSVASSLVQAGEFFKVSPRLQIVDAGGNKVAKDSTSGIKITISENPTAGSLLPGNNTFAVAIAGVQSIPVVVFPDGSHLVEPSNPAMLTKLHELGILPTS